jgi:hypothetical protein
MYVAGEQGAGFPGEAIIASLLLETERADLRGLVGKEKGTVKISLKSWSLNRIVVTCCSGFEIRRETLIPRTFDDGNVFEVFKWGRESM